jgi:hypothetical protein
MDCRGFEEWLDEGRPANEANDEAAAHAAACDACARSLRHADEWEHALSQRFAVAPDGFTDRVMARLPARTADAALSVPEDRESPWPWWLSMLLEPAALSGLGLGVLYAALAPRLLGSGRVLAPAIVGRLTEIATACPDPVWLQGPAGRLVLVAAAAVTCVGLFFGSTALVGRLTQLRVR